MRLRHFLAGQLAFVTDLSSGWGLVQYADSKLTPIYVTGQKTPDGNRTFAGPLWVTVQMNQRGNVAFSARACAGTDCVYDTYLWDRQTRTMKPVALKGMPAVNGLTFESGGGWRPAVNNSDEVAFTAWVKNGAGQLRRGVFLYGRDGRLLPIALPDEALSGGDRIDYAYFPALNDQGTVAFLAARPGDLEPGAYVWENGTITPVAPVGAKTPDGGVIRAVTGVWVNEKNRTVLVAASLVGTNTSNLYRFVEGKLLPAVVRGQEIADGDRFYSFPQEETVRWVTPGNTSGQHAFFALLRSGSSGIYLLDADGKVTRVLPGNVSTDLGRVTLSIPSAATYVDGISLNNRGQIAVSVAINGVAGTLVVLTPTAP